jgi:hypothetical protein
MFSVFQSVCRSRGPRAGSFRASRLILLEPRLRTAPGLRPTGSRRRCSSGRYSLRTQLPRTQNRYTGRSDFGGPAKLSIQ